MSTPDIEEGAHEQWARHPITSKYRKEAEESRRQAMSGLKNAAVNSTDPRVTRAYALLESLDALVASLSEKGASQ